MRVRSDHRVLPVVLLAVACQSSSASHDRDVAFVGRAMPQVTVDGQLVDDTGDPQDISAVRLSLLAGEAAISITGPVDLELELRQGERVLASGREHVEAVATLAVGDNILSIHEAGEIASPLRTLNLHRTSRLFEAIDILRAPTPAQDAFFGDYLRATDDMLYLNEARRGQLYDGSGDGWVLLRRSEELLPLELSWMYEATLSEDLLAFVAQPTGGVETLYFFSREGHSFTPSGEHETEMRGTLRSAGDDVCLISGTELLFFERGDTRWRLAQRLDAPAGDIGFGERPTYFDAPSVAMTEGLLLVGAPRADVLVTAEGARLASCDALLDEELAAPDAHCERDAGAVFVFERTPAGWDLTQTLLAPEPSAAANFGHSATTDGGWAAFGMPSAVTSRSSEGGVDTDCSGCVETGTAVLFRRNENGFEPHTELEGENLQAYDYFGDSVTLHAGVLLVGAPGHDDGAAEDVGAIHAFVLADPLIPLGPFILPADTPHVFPFPQQMHVTGTSLVIAANTAPFSRADEELENAGLVYVLR